MAGKLTLYRLTEADKTEDTTTDKVEFEGDAAVPDDRSKIVKFDPVLGRHNSENPIPHANISNKPDTGFAGDTYKINVLFDETEGMAAGIARFRDWMANDQTVDGIFDEGNIGLRNDYRPEFNLLPNNEAGYKIIIFEIHHDLAVGYLVPGVIVLEFSGDPKRLGL